MAANMFGYSNIINRCIKDMYKNSARFISFRSLAKLLSVYFHRPSTGSKPPYNHICQIGDPVLRTKATPIDTNVIETPEFQKILEHLHKVMKKSDVCGLSAPQIGFPWQLFAIEITEKSLETIPSQVREALRMECLPLTYFINPTLEIINPKEITFLEMCGSINYYQAEVPRATEIRIKALNRFGEKFCMNAKDWIARVVQHEYDHLQGVLYVDKMFPLTFEYCHWEDRNKK